MELEIEYTGYVKKSRYIGDCIKELITHYTKRKKADVEKKMQEHWQVMMPKRKPVGNARKDFLKTWWHIFYDVELVQYKLTNIIEVLNKERTKRAKFSTTCIGFVPASVTPREFLYGQIFQSSLNIASEEDLRRTAYDNLSYYKEIEEQLEENFYDVIPNYQLCDISDAIDILENGESLTKEDIELVDIYICIEVEKVEKK